MTNLETLIQEATSDGTSLFASIYHAQEGPHSLSHLEDRFNNFLREFATKVFAAGEESGREKAADVVERWARSRFRGGYENSEIRLTVEAARTNK